MNTVLFRDRVRSAFDYDYASTIVEALPTLLAGIVVLLLGYGLAKLLRYIVERLMRRSGLERLAESTGPYRALRGMGGLVTVCGKIVHWLVMLFFVMAAAEVMDLTLVTDGMRGFFAYLPRLLSAIGVLLVGLWLGQKVRALVNGVAPMMGLTSGSALGKILFGVIVLFMGVTALNVAGIDTTLITSNILLFVGGVLVAFSVAYGMASRDILTNILSSYYGKDRFTPGQRVRIGTDEGVIVGIDSIAITLRTADRTVFIPASTLITERIELLADQAPHTID